jgi:hypothetical protein
LGDVRTLSEGAGGPDRFAHGIDVEALRSEVAKDNLTAQPTQGRLEPGPQLPLQGAPRTSRPPDIERGEPVAESEQVTEAIGTELLFENERVRVWSMTIPPGGSSPVHRHRRDWLYAYVTDDNLMETRFADGRRERSLFGDGFVGFYRVGDVEHPDLTHALHNAGDHVHRQILVEFKNEPDPADGAPKRFDNGRRTTS